MSVDPSRVGDAEQAVLATCLADSASALRAAGALKPEDFADPRNECLFRAMFDLALRTGSVDVVLLLAALRAQGDEHRVGGADYLTVLMSQPVTTVNLDHYVGIVVDASRRRRAVHVARRAAQIAQDPKLTPDAAIGHLLTELSTAAHGRTATHSLRSCVEEAISRLDGGTAAPVPTGLGFIDAFFGGLPPEGLVVLAARPSMGKTSMALQIARGLSVRGRVLIWSLEMSRASLATILLSQESGVDSSRLRRGRSVSALTREEDDAIAAAANRLAPLPIDIIENYDVTPESIMSVVSLAAAQGPLAGIVVDYLQLLDTSSVASKNTSREREVAYASAMLKRASRAAHCPVIALSQLSRKGAERRDPRPILSDLRDSGAIEQDADMVMFVHRAEMLTQDPAERALVKGSAELIVSKYREGVVGDVPCRFDAPTQSFRGIADAPPALDPNGFPEDIYQ